MQDSIYLYSRGDRLGSHIIQYLSIIIYAFYNNLYIVYEPEKVNYNNPVYEYEGTKYNESFIVKSILKWIDDSKRVSKPWLKSENKPIEDPDFLYKQICNYIDVWLLSTDMDQGPFLALDFANAYAQNYAADPNSLYLLGKVNYKLENLIESEMALLKLLTRSPNHIDALFLMGYITKKTGQFDRSLSYFKRIKKQGVKAERRKAKTEIKALKKEIKAAR